MAGRTNGAGTSPGPSDSDGPRHVHKMVPGWLSPYLFAGDEQFGTRRWSYWYETLMDLKLLDAPIPQVDFLEQPDRETAKHITHMLQHAERAGMRHSEAFEQWVIWLLHGFGDSEFRAHELVTDVPGFRVAGKVLDHWYEEFQLGRLQMHPADYMAHFAQGGENNGYNPNARSGFFSTPMSLCKAMAEMNFGTYAGDTRPLSVLDPCAGTGSLLLAASNYSLNLHAQELMLNLVRCLRVNAWLYVPWLIYPLPRQCLNKEVAMKQNCTVESINSDNETLVLEGEEWRPIPGYEGLYAVSNLGRVQRVQRGRGTRPGNGILKLRTSGGYKMVTLSCRGVRQVRWVHRLVASAFLGNAEGKQVNHKNAHKSDNRLENLEYVTPAENTAHAWKNGCFPGDINYARGEDHHSAKLKVSDVREIKRLLQSKEANQTQIASRFGVSVTAILNIRKGRSWRQVPSD